MVKHNCHLHLRNNLKRLQLKTITMTFESNSTKVLVALVDRSISLLRLAVIEEDYDDFLQQQQQSIEQQQQNIKVEAPATANQNQTTKSHVP